MKRNFKAIIIMFLIGVVILFASWNSLKKKIISEHSNSKAKIHPINYIQTGKGEYVDIVKELHWSGKVKPNKKIILISQISGKIVSICCKNGSFVKKGEIIFKIGGKVIKHRINYLKLKIKMLDEKLKIAENILKLKKLSFSRQLIKKDELLEAENKVVNIKSEKLLELSKLKSIKNSLEIVSPINGLFINRTVSLGQAVNKNRKLAEILNTDDLRIEGNVFTDNYKELINKKVFINKKFIGKITKILPEKASSGATVFYIENNQLGKLFKIGENVQGTIKLAVKKHIFAVPESSIIYDETETPYIFAQKENDFRKIRIKTGIKQDGWVEIISGVNPYDKIVVKGGYELFYKDFSKTFKVAD